MAGNGGDMTDDELGHRAVALATKMQNAAEDENSGAVVIMACCILLAKFLSNAPDDQRPEYVLSSLRMVTDMLNSILETRALRKSEEQDDHGPPTSEAKH